MRSDIYNVCSFFTLIVSEKLLLMYGNFCLDKAMALGPSKVFNAICQHSKVSLISAGLKTFRFGIARSPASCSIG